ncbi:MAG: acetyl-CoA C-acyltransferase [Vicinamibacterales bacterium]
MSAPRVVILSSARTPIGKYGGSFRDVHPAELGAVASRAAIARAGLAPGDIQEVWMGHGRQAGSGPNPGRQIAYRSGVPVEAPAQTINKACASGLQAIASGAQSILLGESEVVLAGGVESMSRMPYLVDSIDARWGHRMGNFQFVDAMYRDGFQCPLSNLIMGETAEILARQYGITREDSDAYALGSQQKAEAAQAAGRFADEIAPVTVTVKGAPVEVTTDEHPRPGSTIEGLRRLPPTFPVVEGEPGIITAGSASGITDGGAALVLASSPLPPHTASRRWPPSRAGRAPGLTRASWASAPCPPRASSPRGRASRSTRSISSSSTRPLPSRCWPCCARCPSTPRGSTSMAAPSRSATPSAPRARESS